MDLYKRERSKYWIADFTVNGQRFRKSTKQTTKARASEVAAEFLRQAQRNEAPVRKGQALTLRQFAEERFLLFVEASTLAEQSKLYYRAGWRMLKSLPVASLRLDCITTSVADTLELKGTGSNQNCALRSLRRMLSLAHEHGILQAARLGTLLTQPLRSPSGRLGTTRSYPGNSCSIPHDTASLRTC